MDINDFRRDRLHALVKEAGGPTEFVKRYSRSDADKPIDATYVSQIINGHRKLGEKAARNMERRAGLKPGYLDDSEMLNPLEPTGAATCNG